MGHYECSECGVFMGFCGCASKRAIERPPQSDPVLSDVRVNQMEASLMTLSADQLEEIIRQAYCTGVKDAQDNHPSIAASPGKKKRVKQILKEVERQIASGTLKCH